MAESGEENKQSKLVNFNGCSTNVFNSKDVSFTCMETLESKTSWQRVQWYRTNVCMSSRCFCRSSTEENCLSQLSHTYWVDVVV